MGSVLWLGLGIGFSSCNKDQVENPETKHEEQQEGLWDGGRISGLYDHYILTYSQTATSADEVVFKARPMGNDLQLVLEVSNDDLEVHPFYGQSGFTAKDTLAALKYDSLVKAHKDYYGKLTDLEDLMMRALFRRIEGLHITSDQDYDEQHPAGTRLDDLMTIEFASADEYFACGFDDEAIPVWGETTKRLLSGYAAQMGKGFMQSLEEFNRTERRLVSSFFILRFDRAPRQEGPYRFTVHFSNEDGIQWEKTTDPIQLPYRNENSDWNQATEPLQFPYP